MILFWTMKVWMLYLLLAVAISFSFLAGLYHKFPGDVSIMTWVQDLPGSITKDFMESVSALGESWLIYTLAGIFTLGIFIFRLKNLYIATVGIFIVLSLLGPLKWLIDRPRPPAEIYGLGNSLEGLSFPSGHAFHSFILFGFLFYLATIFINRTLIRRIVQFLLIFIILAIGISRIYLGAHWPSDILGAYLLGASFLGLIIRYCITGTPQCKSD